MMKTTNYFRNSVLVKRPYLSEAICRAVIANYVRKELQSDGRFCYWGEITFPGEHTPRIVRVVTLDDGETIHNGFKDRNFRRRFPL